MIKQNIINEKDRLVLNNYKFGIPIIQSIFYYSILILLFHQLKYLFNQRVTSFVIGFLALEPTVIQYHGSYWTESIYFSLLILILIFLINLKKDFKHCFLLGLIIGLSCLQRNVSIYLIIPILVYIIINFKKNSFVPIISSISGYCIIILLLGYTNYIRSGIFYITPWDQKDAPFYLLAHKLNNETNEVKYQKRDIWIKEKNLNIDKEYDRRKIAEYQHDYFKEALKNNLFSFVKIHIWKSLQSLVLDPFTIQNEYYTDKTVNHYWQKFTHQLKYRIPYSIIIYSLILIGFIRMFLKENKTKNLCILIFLISCFYTAILGWVGTSRYLVPNLIFLSICFGFGLDSVFKYFENLKIKI